jgi:hypothetical protein
VLPISEEAALVAYPLLFDSVELSEIERSVDDTRIEAVYLPIAMEFAVHPMTLIGQTTIRIVQFSIAMH